MGFMGLLVIELLLVYGIDSIWLVPVCSNFLLSLLCATCRHYSPLLGSNLGKNLTLHTSDTYHTIVYGRVILMSTTHSHVGLHAKHGAAVSLSLSLFVVGVVLGRSMLLFHTI